jgi:NADPH-dependent glutamate synthase beta subunit-like oxidoreductase/ferredoxin
MKKINLNIDGYQIEAEEGQNLLQAALDAGIYIPHLCYHPDLTPQGGCKLCTVEIEGHEGMVQSCGTTVEEGMTVHTKTENVKHSRMVALELMLASHPKDCTSCDKYLNCELQALMQYMGVAHSRLREIDKANTRIMPSDALIRREMYRCIQCGRCIRACQELRGIGALQYNKKDGETYVGTKDDVTLSETDCRFCGACVEVCPTGAIQDVKGIFSKESARNMALIPCKDRCPAHTDIPMYVRLVEQGRYSEAVSVFREKLTFPHSLGYVCTHACESGCKRNHVNGPISIRELKRFAVENDQEESWKERAFHCAPTGKKAAVIGGGPAGMTAAFYLAKKGHDVTVFERQPLAGGMLSYGIPKYRLPQEIVNKEIETLCESGLKLETEIDVESAEALLKNGYDAVLVAVGAQKGKRPPAYCGDWRNVYDAVEFCRMANEGRLPELGDVLTVYGGGNVAFDCARTAKMNGIPTVRVVCLEQRDQMLADEEEVCCALEEGIEICNSKSMTAIEEKEGFATGLKLVNVLSFRFGEKGLELETEEHSETVMATDSMVFATGQQPDLTDSFGVELFRGSFVKIDEMLRTSEEGIFAAGDVVTGTKSVVEAIASGRQAAIRMDQYLGGDGNIEEILYDRFKQNSNIGTVENFACLERRDHLCGECEAKSEALRCLQCDLRLDIQKVKYWVDAHYKQGKEAAK